MSIVIFGKYINMVVESSFRTPTRDYYEFG